MRMKYIPNLLSLFRILFSVSLLFSHRNPALFIAFYFVMGASDFLDGKLARRYHWRSELGVKLDGLGDTLFFLCAFTGMMLPPRLKFDLKKILVTAGVVILIKLGVLVLTRVRFKEWNGMHTYTNKFVGALLFFSVPLFIWMGEVSYPVLLALAVAMCAAAMEEMAILFMADTYNPDHRGLLAEKLFAGRTPAKKH